MTQGKRAARWTRLRSKLTYANIMATVAVFLGLGGVGYAATESLRQLNSDQGRPLWSGRTYTVTQAGGFTSGRGYTTGAVYCDEFDVPIGGGFALPASLAGKVTQSSSVKKDGENPGISVRGWQVQWLGTADVPNARIQVRCADFLNLHKD